MNYKNEFLIFLDSVIKEDYNKAFKYFDILNNNPIYKRDCDFYLCLLSMVTNIPDKYKEYVKQIKIGDILIKSNGHQINKINNIRKLIYNEQLTEALKETRFIENNNSIFLVKRMLYKAIKNKSKNKKILSDLINEKRYKDIIMHLRSKLILNKSEKYIFILTNEIININNKQPFRHELFSKDLLLKTFISDYSLVIELIKNNEQIEYKRMINILLEELNNLIEPIKINSVKC